MAVQSYISVHTMPRRVAFNSRMACTHSLCAIVRARVSSHFRTNEEIPKNFTLKSLRPHKRPSTCKMQRQKTNYSFLIICPRITHTCAVTGGRSRKKAMMFANSFFMSSSKALKKQASLVFCTVFFKSFETVVISFLPLSSYMTFSLFYS